MFESPDNFRPVLLIPSVDHPGWHAGLVWIHTGSILNFKNSGKDYVFGAADEDLHFLNRLRIQDSLHVKVTIESVLFNGRNT